MQNLTRTTLLLSFFMLSGCSVTKQLNKQSQSDTAKRDSVSETQTAAKVHALAALDSAGRTSQKTTAKETATNETVEDVTVTTYDVATGNKTAVTTTRRRITGTSVRDNAASLENHSQLRREVRSDSDTKQSAKTEVKTQLQHETKTKAVAKKTEPAVRAWLIGGAVTLALAALVWAVIPSLAAFGGGGPVWWLIAAVRRKREQPSA